MVDSPQDPLLPQTELNVDNLTLGNKRVTHRNVQPVTVSSPFGGALRAWPSLNFNNGYREPRFFDFVLEQITVADAQLQMILPKVQLQDALERSVKGFEVHTLGKDGLRLMIAEARRQGLISPYVLTQLDTFDDPILLQVQRGATQATLRNVLIPPGGKVVGVFTIAVPPEAVAQQNVRFEVNQYTRGRLIGGSEFTLTTPRKRPQSNLRRLRVVLEKVQILDDKDPWIFGRGEFFFTAEVMVNDDPVRGGRWLVPQQGSLKVSDKPGKNIVEIEQPVFDGAVEPGDHMSISLLATELDLFTRDDRSTRYLRTFSGDPESWIGSYRPDDEPGDPERMRDWKVWYRIEGVP
jgi:hypothetical protein